MSPILNDVSRRCHNIVLASFCIPFSCVVNEDDKGG